MRLKLLDPSLLLRREITTHTGPRPRGSAPCACSWQFSLRSRGNLPWRSRGFWKLQAWASERPLYPPPSTLSGCPQSCTYPGTLDSLRSLGAGGKGLSKVPARGAARVEEGSGEESERGGGGTRAKEHPVPPPDARGGGVGEAGRCAPPRAPPPGRCPLPRFVQLLLVPTPSRVMSWPEGPLGSNSPAAVSAGSVGSAMRSRPPPPSLFL